MNDANYHKKNTRKGMARWERLSTGNCARKWNFIILTNGIYLGNLFLKIKLIKLSETLSYFETDPSIQARRPDLILLNKKRRTSRQQSESERKQKAGLYQRIEKAEEHESDNDINFLGTEPKNLEKRHEELEIRRRIETTQTTTLLK